MLLSFESLRRHGARVWPLAAVLWTVATLGRLAAASAQVVFYDGFDVPGDWLDRSEWTTEFGNPSLIPRTQLRDWVTPTGVGRFIVANGVAHLDLDTFNPTGFSLYGTHAKSIMSFQPDATTDFELV